MQPTKYFTTQIRSSAQMFYSAKTTWISTRMDMFFPIERLMLGMKIVISKPLIFEKYFCTRTKSFTDFHPSVQFLIYYSTLQVLMFLLRNESLKRTKLHQLLPTCQRR